MLLICSVSTNLNASVVRCVLVWVGVCVGVNEREGSKAVLSFCILSVVSAIFTAKKY